MRIKCKCKIEDKENLKGKRMLRGYRQQYLLERSEQQYEYVKKRTMLQLIMSVVVERRYSQRSNRRSWVRIPAWECGHSGFFFTFVFCHIAEAIDAARRCLLIFISFLFFPHAFISRLFLFSRLMMDSRAGAHTHG